MFQLTFYDFLKTICVILQHFPFNPTDRIMFICLKPRICCDYHKTSFGGRHGPLPVLNSGRPPRLVELLSRDGQELELEQPHGSPTAPARWPRASALAAGNKESFPRQLGAGALKLWICFIPLGSDLCPCKWSLLCFSPNLNECAGTAAAWLGPAKPYGHPWGRGRPPARGTEAVRAQPSHCVSLQCKQPRCASWRSGLPPVPPALLLKRLHPRFIFPAAGLSLRGFFSF